MKNIILKIALVATLSISMASCKKFLETDPIGKVSKNLLFKDVNGAKAGLNGAYNRVLNYYKSDFSMYADVASDNLISKSSETSTMLQPFNFQSTVGDDELAAGRIWISIFEALNNTNNVINAILDLKASFPSSSAELDAIKAQALVLRALCHFDLSRVYSQPYNFTADASHLGAPVLLKTPSPGENTSRKTMKETYDQIILDITTALPELQKQAHNQYVVNYKSALGLLSRVYLYKGDWEQSIEAANLVINDQTYTLATAANYKSVFTKKDESATAKVETLFQLTSKGLVSSISDIHIIYSDTAAAEYNTSKKTLDLFDTNDIRKIGMFNSPKKGSNSGKQFTAKYSAAGKTTRNDTVLVKVVRLSEIYLNRAEAKWNQMKYAEAAEDIRIISQRAHPSQNVLITYNTPADLYKIIADERNRELCFEGHRLFDLLRRKENLQRGSDCNSTTCSLTYPNNKFVLPIPLKETDANKSMQQNPGYN
jgi:hypothetical protein